MTPRSKFDESYFVTTAMNLELNRASFGKGATEIREKIAIAPHAWALFLDLDGTLLDIAGRPEDVVVPSGLVADLDQICAGLFGALAIVSGRSLVDIDRFLHPLRFGAAAEHGSRIRFAESEQVVSLATEFSPSIASAVEFAVRNLDGVTVEQKESAVSVHYRAAPHSRKELSDALDRVLAQSDANLRILPGRCVFEFVPSHASKAHAVETLMTSATFRGRQPVFIGDDASDEDACIFVEKTAGVALPVAGEYFGPERAAFQSPDDVRRWISKLARDLRCSPGVGCR